MSQIGEASLQIKGFQIAHRGHGEPDEDIFSTKLVDNTLKILINQKQRGMITADRQMLRRIEFPDIEIDQMPTTKGFLLRCQLYVKDQKVAYAQTRIELNMDSKQQNKIALKKVDLSPTQTDAIMMLMWNVGKDIDKTQTSVHKTPHSGYSQKEIAQIQQKLKIIKVISYEKKDLYGFGIKDSNSKRLVQEMPFINHSLQK